MKEASPHIAKWKKPTQKGYTLRDSNDDIAEKAKPSTVKRWLVVGVQEGQMNTSIQTALQDNETTVCTIMNGRHMSLSICPNPQTAEERVQH